MVHFQRVTCVYTFWHSPGLQLHSLTYITFTITQHLVKVLKPGGILIFNSRIGPENQKYVEVLTRYADELVAANVIKLKKMEKVHYGGIGDDKIYAYAWIYSKI